MRAVARAQYNVSSYFGQSTVCADQNGETPCSAINFFSISMESPGIIQPQVCDINLWSNDLPAI